MAVGGSSTGTALGVGHGEAQFGAEHGGQADGARRLRKAHHAVEAVVVGDGERAEAKPPASAAISSGWLAPSRKLKAEWACSSA